MSSNSTSVFSLTSSVSVYQSWWKFRLIVNFNPFICAATHKQIFVQNEDIYMHFAWKILFKEIDIKTFVRLGWHFKIRAYAQWQHFNKRRPDTGYSNNWLWIWIKKIVKNHVNVWLSSMSTILIFKCRWSTNFPADIKKEIQGLWTLWIDILVY